MIQKMPTTFLLTENNPLRLISHGMLILTAFIWGTTFVFQTTGMETLGPFGFTTIRFLTGTVALLPFALRERSKQGNRDRRPH